MKKFTQKILSALSQSIDPVVHASLVTLAIVFVHWLFRLIGVEVGNEVAQGLAEILVGYILSLFGFAFWVRATISRRATAVTDGPAPYEYRPFLMR